METRLCVFLDFDFERCTSLVLAIIMLLGSVAVMRFDAVAATPATDDLIFTAQEIYDLAEPGVWGDKYGCMGYDEVTHYKKNGTEFVRLLSAGGPGTAEAYFHLFYTTHAVAPVIAIKYRTQVTGISMENKDRKVPRKDNSCLKQAFLQYLYRLLPC